MNDRESIERISHIVVQNIPQQALISSFLKIHGFGLESDFSLVMQRVGRELCLTSQ